MGKTSLSFKQTIKLKKKSFMQKIIRRRMASKRWITNLYAILHNMSVLIYIYIYTLISIPSHQPTRPIPLYLQKNPFGSIPPFYLQVFFSSFLFEFYFFLKQFEFVSGKNINDRLMSLMWHQSWRLYFLGFFDRCTWVFQLMGSDLKNK